MFYPCHNPIYGKDLYLPASVTYIGGQAGFEKSMTFHVIPNSYAHKWVVENECKFVLENAPAPVTVPGDVNGDGAVDGCGWQNNWPDNENPEQREPMKKEKREMK